MLIHPELRALRGDDTPQRQAQVAMRDVYERWRHEGPGARIEAELGIFGGGADLDDLPLLSALMAPDDPGGTEFAQSLVRTFVARLAASPLSHMPLRHSGDGPVTSVLVARCGGTTLSLLAVDGLALARQPEARTISFAAVETYEKVLAGEGRASRVRIAARAADGADLDCHEVSLAGGDLAHRLGTEEAQIIRSVRSTLVTLKLQRRLGGGLPSREYRLADGRLVHQAAGDPRDSRLELAASLLGRMGRSDAAPLLAAMAEEEGSPSLRWQALRECLGLDSATGFAAVCHLAERPGDPLAAKATALRAQLLQTYPQLAGVQPCRA